MPSEPRPPRRRWPFGVAAGLVVAGVIGVAVGLTSGGTASTAEPVATTTTPKSVACNPGQHQSTPEAYYDCVNGAWVRGTAPTPTTTTPPATVPPTAPPTTAPPTTEAPTTVPPTTQPVETTTPPPPPPGPAPTINITCPTPKNSGADSLRADFGYDFHATTPALVRWGIEYGDGRSYTADNEAKARTQVFWHYYRSPGTFTVTAWVEDAIGRRASDSCQFTWTQPPPPPTPTADHRHHPTEIVPDPPYRFRQTADGEPIRWRACLAMHWRYNPAGEPSPGTINVVRAAVAEISAASGIEMIEDGVTSIDVSDPDQVLPSLAEGEVVIGFAPPGSPAIPRSVRRDLPADVEPTPLSWAPARLGGDGADITRRIRGDQP